MIIKLSPQRRDDALTVTKAGEVLTINGETFDFSVIPDGATLPAAAVKSEWIGGDVSRIDGALNLTLLLPHGPNATEAQRFPADIVDPPDGEVDLPKDPPAPEVATDE